MKPTISEFSYGYAVTDELVHDPVAGVIGAPVFATQFAEGRTGGGYDLRLNRAHLPLFVQFKLTDYMKRGTCVEQRLQRLRAPCYRMHLRPARFSRQHQLLLDLEQLGHEVYYSAPAFHTPGALDRAFAARSVRAQSKWIRPSQIGPLPDQYEHHVSFHHPGPFFLFSEPVALHGSTTFEDAAVRWRRLLREQSAENLESDFKLLGDLERVLHNQGADYRPPRLLGKSAPATIDSPIRAAAYLAATYLESQLFLIGHADDSIGKSPTP